MPKPGKKPRRNPNGLLAWLAYAAVRVFAAMVNAVPLEWNYRACRLLGDLLYALDRRHRHRALEHLRLSYPQWPPERIERTARASLRNFVYLGLEMLFTTRMITLNRWRNFVQLGENMPQALRLLIERKSGVLMLTGHFGNWEVLGYVLATLGFPTVSIARRLDNPRIDAFVLGVREQTGQRIIDKRGASALMDGLLKNNEAIGFIADQDAGRKGVFVDFFGRKASAYKTIALIAIQYNVPIVCGYAVRLGDGYKFRLGVNRIIEPAEWADQPDPVRWITQEYTTALEQLVRAHPEQYLWVHRRWKHRPKGEPDAPGGIA